MAKNRVAPQYAELHCLSNFSFLRGASHPPELVVTAAELGYAGLALTDECSVAGIVRAHTAAKAAGFKLVVGSEITFIDGLKVVVLAVDRRSYAALCRLITRARRAAEKGTYRASRDDLAQCVADSNGALLWIPAEHQADRDALLATGGWLRERFAGRVWLAAELLHGGNDRRLLREWRAVGAELDMPLVAAGNVHMHCRERRMLQDTLTAIRLKTPLDKLGFDLRPNAERCLRPLPELARRYPPELLRETLAILERVNFSLDELRYEYPHELVPEGETPTSHLRLLTEQGRDWRWPAGAPAKVLERIEHELRLIADLSYEAFFLTVHDVVRHARSEGILCQGRGSAANSVVCFCLGITEVDPARMQTLVERFISKERNEPPDIDVDFEHDRREEVIQYIYRKYSRERAALAATVISYRPRSAVRDVGKALGLDDLQVTMVARSMHWWDARVAEDRVADAGLDPGSVKVRRWLSLVDELIGFPRHLSQHVGGFVIAERALDELVPVENAAMPERTVIQWDKDDLEELGLLKVDVLALGMLSAIRRCFGLIEGFGGPKYTIATVPAEDENVYGMISRADTMGVFQIESRAQMAMLPRLRPKEYYDLVIEVALIRPGPIQGDMVHPYLRRRSGEEAVTYPSEAVREVLERTLGVPIFQEQVMHLAMVAADFSGGEADQLRRAMASWRRNGDLERFERRLIDGMLARNYEREFAERIFNQIKGFGEYGFPESHAASFALLVYVSAWLKHHEPAAFCCALLNSQPMGFYAPQQLVRNAREHGVEVRPVDVSRSDWDSTLERREEDGRPALRLGLNTVKGLAEEGGRRLVEARRDGPFDAIRDVAERAVLGAKDLGALASAGAFKSLASNRHRARWDVAGIEKPTALLPSLRFAEALPMLRRPTESEDIASDYRHLGLTLGRHPLALLRGRLEALRVRSAREVADLEPGARVRTAGLVITRQRPASASGVMFVTLEDETGYLNLIVWDSLAQSERRVATGAALMGVVGKVQKEGTVLHVIAEHFYDHSDMLGDLVTRSRDFH